MAITLASDSSSDALITDGIGRGDLPSAARLWVRHWPTALAAARLYVDRDEVPGLAAEALIGTISLTATGRGPREDVAAFVTDLVRELGADESGTPLAPGEAFPDVFVSPGLTSAFADLPAEDQHALRTEPDSSEDFELALTILQTSYLTTHLGEVPTRDCRPAHIAMMAEADGSARTGFAAHNWLHLSTCAWCTEAFHEISFANVALPALIAAGVWDVVVAPAVELPLAVALDDQIAEAPVEHPVLASVESAEKVRSFEGETVTIDAITAEDPDLARDEDDEDRRGGLLGSGRQRLIAAGVAAVLVAGVAFALTRNDDSTSPTAAPAHSPTSSATSAEPGPTADAGTDDVGGLPEGSPTVSVAGPTRAPQSTVTSAPADAPTAAKASSKPKPTKAPTKAPATTTPPAPPATSEPAAPTPTPDPEPTPTAAPTKSCNGLQHLLGLC